MAGIFGNATRLLSSTDAVPGVDSALPKAGSPESSILDDFLGKAKEKIGDPLKKAAGGVGGALLDAPGTIVDKLGGILSGKDRAGGAMLEGLAQSGVADLVDAGGIFAGKTPAQRRFVSPTIIQERQDVADLIRRSNLGQESLLNKIDPERRPAIQDRRG